MSGVAQAPLRSWLFVPGDSERKQVKGLSSPADALILDLEDSVDPQRLPVARSQVRELLRAQRGAGPVLWVRVNPTQSAACGQDLEVLFEPAPGARPPAGLVLPKVSSAQELMQFAARLATLESRLGTTPGSVRLLPLVTETAAGLLNLPQYPAILGAAPPVLARLTGLTWGAEDLGAAVGALAKYGPDNRLTFTFQLARTTCLLAAAALGVPAVDTVNTDLRNSAALHGELEQARRDGFSGKLAVHPDQVDPINAAFTPTEAELAHARRVAAVFAAAGAAGVASLDGQMIDRPHLLLAQRVIAAAERHRGQP